MTSSRNKWLSQDMNSEPSDALVHVGFLLHYPPSPRDVLGAEGVPARLALDSHPHKSRAPSSPLRQPLAAASSC